MIDRFLNYVLSFIPEDKIDLAAEITVLLILLGLTLTCGLMYIIGWGVVVKYTLWLAN